MARWGLFAEETVGSGDARRWEFELLGHAEGTREEALGKLEEAALAYRPSKPFSVRRSWLYRSGEGFVQVNEGVTTTYICRFTVAELVRDSKDPKVAATAEPWDRVPEGF
ncbi:hypothetical protein OG937_14365 [Streptomyces sp. NBC_00510]|nr:hypothetical protein [Streptomyces sp. PA03-1a]MDX2704542.1 hypothetical protein [Streptomyces sp. PA03-6a]MDX2816888.1 hypothetical protein [Streptomyces sp. PA03-5A]